ncbi:calcium-activated chloride channel regulator 1-like [Acipenser ruthenus]|uniref:calcium-activated chloride channel regulator 1-like n=1 Tax=Acipenser ruthenus TaxID=7906 RepID=UPI002741E9AB|nr:calcium-activated chloride channel regulator 1-like [Acipenser ruthenus]
MQTATMYNMTLFSVLLYLLFGVFLTDCSTIELINNGYNGVVIAIHPKVSEDPKLIENIKGMVKEASSYLFTATRRRAFYRDVKILVPSTWAENHTLYKKPTRESYKKASIIVADPFCTDIASTPYAVTNGQCGEEGKYIHFTPKYLLQDEVVDNFGPRGRVFVHTWANFRWGVFSEYDTLKKPFYRSSKGQIEATRCSKDITGYLINPGTGSSCETDTSTGLPKADCTFIPHQKQNTNASIMFQQFLPDVTDFCDENTHNDEAPNQQNKICNYRSTWEVIRQTKDFRGSNPPVSTSPPEITFTLLQARHRVVCLVLDVSGSMGGFDRITRLRRASEVFLMEIIDKGSWVGIVTFSSDAAIQKSLTLIDSEAVRTDLISHLPSTAGGGTNICSGIRKGFEVLRGDDGETSGDEIILLTDGEDSAVRSCLEEVKNSGSIIHTVALGPSADSALEEMSNATGGLQFYASDKLDSSGLIDVFSSLSVSSGDFAAEVIQLTSDGKQTDAGKWFHGTIYLDSTVGNNTVFTITWQTDVPTILITSPNSQSYSNEDLQIKTDLRIGRLTLPGTAQPGLWGYNILNSGKSQQSFTVTVNSRAVNECVPPITVNAEMNTESTSYPTPVIIYAEVNQGYTPVINANVTAIIELANTSTVELSLLDSGSGADAFKNDGVYSSYFFSFGGNGRYSLKIKVLGLGGTVKVTTREGNSLPYRSGYISQNGTVHFNKPPYANDTTSDVGSFSRSGKGSTLTVSKVPADPTDEFPPGRVTDLTASIVDDKIQLTWTAPGDDFDKGLVSSYKIKMSGSMVQLRDNFTGCDIINTTTLQLKPAGEVQVFLFPRDAAKIFNSIIIYFALTATDDAGHTSELSVIAQVSIFMFKEAIPTTSWPMNSSSTEPYTIPALPHSTCCQHEWLVLLLVGMGLFLHLLWLLMLIIWWNVGKKVIYVYSDKDTMISNPFSTGVGMYSRQM